MKGKEAKKGLKKIFQEAYISLVFINMIMLISCNSENDVLPQKAEFDFPQELLGGWIHPEVNWGFRLSEPGVIQFIGLNTESGKLINYLDQVDSIFFIDSTRFVFRASNCFELSVFGTFQPADTGIYSFTEDTLNLELINDFDLGNISIPFIREDMRVFDGDSSFFTADVTLNDELIEFENGTLFRKKVGYYFDEDASIMLLVSESKGSSCILPSEFSEFNIELTIEKYQGIGSYQLYTGPNPNRADYSFINQAISFDVFLGYAIEGNVEIVEQSESHLVGNFAGELCCNQDSTIAGRIENGRFAIYH